jgi:hypothetical protein
MAQVIVLPCPKCGGENVVTRFHEDRAACGYTACDGANYGRGGRKDQALYGKEHLAQRCENCLYVWAVATRSDNQHLAKHDE